MNESWDENERKAADAADDIFAHFIDIESNENGSSSIEGQALFWHIATIEHENALASFTARLQDVTVSHCLIKGSRCVRLDYNVEGVMIDTEAAGSSSLGKEHYLVYCTHLEKTHVVIVRKQFVVNLELDQQDQKERLLSDSRSNKCGFHFMFTLWNLIHQSSFQLTRWIVSAFI